MTTSNPGPEATTHDGHPPASDGGTTPASHAPVIGADQLAELRHLTPRELHTRLMCLRDQALADYHYYCRAIDQVRAELRQRGGQEAAAKALGVSRATIRRAGQ